MSINIPIVKQSTSDDENNLFLVTCLDCFYLISYRNKRRK